MEIFELEDFQDKLQEERLASEISDMFRLMGDDDDYGNMDGDEMFI